MDGKQELTHDLNRNPFLSFNLSKTKLELVGSEQMRCLNYFASLPPTIKV